MGDNRIITEVEWEDIVNANVSRESEEGKEEWIALLRRLEESKEATDFDVSYNLQLLPDELGSLVSLKTLSISCGGLCRLPTTLGQLQNLLEFSLCGCSSLFSIPPEIGDLQRLKKLSIISCYHLRNIPSSIGKMESLEMLVLASLLRLTRLPDSLGELSNLRALCIHECDLLAALPDSFSRLASSLQSLSASWCMNLRLLPSQVVQLQNLRALSLHGSPVLSRLPDNISEMTRLSRLTLNFCLLESRDVLMTTCLPPRLRSFSSLLLCEEGLQADNEFMLQFLKRNPYLKHVGTGDSDDEQEIEVEVSQDAKQLLALNQFRPILKGGHLSVSPSQFSTVLGLITSKLHGDTAGQVAVIYSLLQMHSPPCWYGLEEATQGKKRKRE